MRWSSYKFANTKAALLLSGLITALVLPASFSAAEHSGSPGQTRAPSITIRVKVVRSTLLVPVNVNGEQLTFILDSAGGSGFLLDEKAANKLNLVSDGEQLSWGAGDSRVSLRLVRDLDIEFAGIHSFHATAGVTDLSAVSQYLETPVDGLLGSNVFLSSIILVDYCRREIQVISPEPFRVPRRQATIIPTALVAGHFASYVRIHFAAGRQLNGMFLLDTGAGPVQIGITRDKAERAHLKDSTEHTAIPALGGEFRATVFRAERVKIGNVTVRNVSIHAAENTAGGMARGEYAGIVGGEFFREFITIFDIPHRRLILSPAPACN